MLKLQVQGLLPKTLAWCVIAGQRATTCLDELNPFSGFVYATARILASETLIRSRDKKMNIIS